MDYPPAINIDNLVNNVTRCENLTTLIISAGFFYYKFEMI